MESSARQPIGFVLLSFSRPEQTISLCRKLSEVFGDPPIALHHDFGQCNLDRRALPSNVHLVEPWLATGWGVFSIVEANLAALSLLYQVADPDWCVSLSTTDYPIKTAERSGQLAVGCLSGSSGADLSEPAAPPSADSCRWV